MREQYGEKNPFYGKRHTEETRQKMREAHKRGRDIICRNPEEGYRLLITAVIGRALKDNAMSFFNTETGKYYCDIIGVNPDTLLEKGMPLQPRV